MEKLRQRLHQMIRREERLKCLGGAADAPKWHALKQGFILDGRTMIRVRDVEADAGVLVLSREN